MQLTERHKEYWRRNIKMTAILLAIWFVVTYIVGWYARELNAITVFGFPLGFYMAAQGGLVLFLMIIWWYNRQMKKIDVEFGLEDD